MGSDNSTTGHLTDCLQVELRQQVVLYCVCYSAAVDCCLFRLQAELGDLLARPGEEQVGRW
jgi:hypothetical protein